MKTTQSAVTFVLPKNPLGDVWIHCNLCPLICSGPTDVEVCLLTSSISSSSQTLVCSMASCLELSRRGMSSFATAAFPCLR